MGWSQVTDFDGDNAKKAIIIVLAFIITSAVISTYNYYFYTSRFIESKAQEIGSLISNGGEFGRVAKELLDTRADLAYLKLLGANGEIKESFGTDGGEGIRRFRLSLGDGQAVMFGLREVKDENSIIRPLIWDVLIGILFAAICVLGVFALTPAKSSNLEKLINGIKRVARGDLSARLNVDKAVQKDTTMIRLFEGFNQMVDQIRRREGAADAVEYTPYQTAQPLTVASSNKEDSRQRKITTFVAKISNFEELSKKLDASELTSFLAEYRKTASSVVSGYGGVVESLLQDEIVALFNVPDEQHNAELKAVCTGVELLQVLANMNTKRKVEGKDIIGGKVGIETKAMPFYGDGEIPQGVKGIVDLARRICDNAPQWNILVSSDLYNSVSDHVDVREYPTENGTVFAIVGVDEEVLQV